MELYRKKPSDLKWSSAVQHEFHCTNLLTFYKENSLPFHYLYINNYSNQPSKPKQTQANPSTPKQIHAYKGNRPRLITTELAHLLTHHLFEVHSTLILVDCHGQVLKGLSSEIEGGSKVVSIDRSPFKLPTLCSRF
jgi:hypothetical protein